MQKGLHKRILRRQQKRIVEDGGKSALMLLHEIVFKNSMNDTSGLGQFNTCSCVDFPEHMLKKKNTHTHIF